MRQTELLPTSDQAQGLRSLAGSGAPQAVEQTALVTRRPAARVIAVTSGKGGVGKTNISVNLALSLASSGQRVTLLDADLGLANAHVLLGITPQSHLGHVIAGSSSLNDIIVDLAHGARLIPGGSAIAELARISDRDRNHFVAELSSLDGPTDILLVDTGAGLSDNVLAFVLAADEAIVVTTPEPTAIADAYATIKVVSGENPAARLRILVNMAATESEAAQTVARLRLVAKQFLDVDIESIGWIPQDEYVRRAVRAQRPIVRSYPDSSAARAIAVLAEIVLDRRRTTSGASGFVNRLACFFSREPRNPEYHSAAQPQPNGPDSRS